jgi:AmmeMemoRadiSam system protein B
MFHLSAKDFQSPLGVLPCSADFVARVASRFGVTRAFADEFLHKKEHSLELQLPFISRVKPNASIAPILVGSFHRAIASGKSPHEFEEYETFIGSLVEAIQTERAQGKRVCFIAGVDMAHVGSFFGDEWALSPERMEGIAERDGKYLDAIEARDTARLFAHVAEDNDARRICGFPTMYTVIDTLNRLGISYTCQARSYQQAVDYQSGCAVTFAGMAFYEA